ncbi:tetratricopeptide repeat protein [Pendulispora rubella]|uniref:Tetratricopeptide repeat protein n=1 Tax=Pendulispora rubella TaxID=2741070 RepID=A0ABZ2LLH9_9BACT
MHSQRPPSAQRSPARRAPDPTPESAGPAAGATGATRAAEGLELRLAIGKGGLGLELGRPFSMGVLEIMELVIALPTVRFPLDVSGGVSRFRHRRGTLDRISAELPVQRLRRWAAGRLRGLIGVGPCEVWVGVEKYGASFALSSEIAILAFSVAVTVTGEDVSLMVTRARGTGLPAPPTAMAISAIEALIGNLARREGARFVVPRAVTKVARALLPEAGVRTPGTADVSITSIAAAHDAWIVHASAHPVAAEPTEIATRALEAVAITRAADEARLGKDYEGARALDLLSLERAPRHPEIASRIAEIDAFVGGRAEAALATIAEVDREEGRGSHLDFLRAELLAETGDVRGAIAAFERAGEHETAPVLAARAFERAAELTRDALEAAGWLDRAVAHAPAVPRIRWARVQRRLALGRTQDARADVEHLEAQASGPRARYDVWWRAGAAWQDQGLVADAAPLFERALRFVPDDAHALAGLGRALVARGKTARGVALLTRAIDLREDGNEDAAGLHIDLAKALAEKLDDRPAAIVHVRAVRHGGRDAVEARALEGRWRAELGDVAGASLAFARLRDHAETLPPGNREAHEPTAAFLLEAAIFEREVLHDSLAAQRHLAAALRLCPNHFGIASAYRAVGAEIAGIAAPPPAPPSELGESSDGFSPDEFANMEGLSMARLPPSPPSIMNIGLGGTGEHGDDVQEAEDEARVEELTRQLQADPTRDDVVDELVDRLLRLGRSHELFALLSARLEDATPDRRVTLVPKQRDVLTRLEADARARGQDLEAQLFASARDALS